MGEMGVWRYYGSTYPHSANKGLHSRDLCCFVPFHDLINGNSTLLVVDFFILSDGKIFIRKI